MSGFGFLSPESFSSDFNGAAALVEQMLAAISTCKVVRVTGVEEQAAVGPVGFVSVVPLVKQMDGAGNVYPQGVYNKIPYLRYQSGGVAVILDPQVGDIGIMVCADRDISSVKENRGEGNPGSWALLSASDGLYLGGVLNAKPTSYVKGDKDGWTWTPDEGKTSIKLTPGVIRLEADRIETHARVSNAWDTNGTGYVYDEAGNRIRTYTDGITPEHHPPDPPEVPLA